MRKATGAKVILIPAAFAIATPAMASQDYEQLWNENSKRVMTAMVNQGYLQGVNSRVAERTNSVGAPYAELLGAEAPQGRVYSKPVALTFTEEELKIRQAEAEIAKSESARLKEAEDIRFWENPIANLFSQTWKNVSATSSVEVGTEAPETSIPLVQPTETQPESQYPILVEPIAKDVGGNGTPGKKSLELAAGSRAYFDANGHKATSGLAKFALEDGPLGFELSAEAGAMVTANEPYNDKATTTNPLGRYGEGTNTREGAFIGGNAGISISLFPWLKLKFGAGVKAIYNRLTSNARIRNSQDVILSEGSSDDGGLWNENSVNAYGGLGFKFGQLTLDVIAGGDSKYGFFPGVNFGYSIPLE